MNPDEHSVEPFENESEPSETSPEDAEPDTYNPDEAIEGDDSVTFESDPEPETPDDKAEDEVDEIDVPASQSGSVPQDHPSPGAARPKTDRTRFRRGRYNR